MSFRQAKHKGMSYVCILTLPCIPSPGEGTRVHETYGGDCSLPLARDGVKVTSPIHRIGLVPIGEGQRATVARFGVKYGLDRINPYDATITQ